jgi:hypothetical protein
VQHVFRLNEDKAETYQHVWGDKETFWLAALLAGEPFAFHPREAHHECCGLLAFDVLAHSRLWRRRISLVDNGMALKGTKLPGLVQRGVDGLALFYHRKHTDVGLPSVLAIEHNERLCRAGWAIDELRGRGAVRGFPLNHWFVRLVASRRAAARLLALIVVLVLAFALRRHIRACLDRAHDRLRRETQRTDGSDEEPLLDRRVAPAPGHHA